MDDWQNSSLAVRQIQRDPDLTEHNRTLLLRYHTEMVAQGLGMRRILRKICDLRVICKRWLPGGKDFETLNIDDVKLMVAAIETSSYSEYTKKGFKISLRSFFWWARGGGRMPEEVAWFKTRMRRRQAKLPEDMLTEDEVGRMINAAYHPRARAMIAVLYESGCRIGELMSLRLKNVAFDRHGALMLVHGKTGYRRIRIVASVPYLAEWLNDHPRRDDPDALVFTRLSNDGGISYNVVRFILQKAARRAGVKKRVNPHNFRHSRATALARHSPRRR